MDADFRLMGEGRNAIEIHSGLLGHYPLASSQMLQVADFFESKPAEVFVFGAHFLDTSLGALNTVVLIFSSFTIAWAVRAAQLKQVKLLKWLIIATMICAFVFMGVKYVEYSAKFEHHLFPGPNFQWNGLDAPHVEMFFNLYFALTGLHALHMVIGMGILLVVAVLAWKGRFSPQNHNLVL